MLRLVSEFIKFQKNWKIFLVNHMCMIFSKSMGMCCCINNLKIYLLDSNFLVKKGKSNPVRQLRIQIYLCHKHRRQNFDSYLNILIWTESETAQKGPFSTGSLNLSLKIYLKANTNAKKIFFRSFFVEFLLYLMRFQLF